MTREEAKKKLEEVLNFAKVIEAYVVGKTIQHMSKGIDTRWEDCHYNVEFDDLMKYYRVKPEPREYWLKVYSDNSSSSFNAKPELGNATEVIKVREIL